MKRTIVTIVSLLFFAPLTHAQEQEIDLSKLTGKDIYVQFCARCHGDDGKGNIPEEMIQNMEAPPPDLTDGYFNTRERRRDWFNVIKFGGGVRGLSMSMPSWGESFSDNQIEECVEYLKTFVEQDRYPQGELNFIRAHTVTKAFVEQEALLIPTFTSRTENGVAVTESNTVLYYANRFGPRFQYEVKLPIQTISSSAQNQWGIGDLELGWKYAFYDDYRARTIATLGLEAALPTGDESKGFGAGTIIVVPYAAAGIGLSDVVELQASAKIETPLEKSKGNPELIYSFSATLTLPESKHGFFPGIEIVGTKNLGVSDHSISLVPKLYIGITQRGHLAVSVGKEIPIYGKEPFDARWRAFFLWDYVDGGLWW